MSFCNIIRSIISILLLQTRKAASLTGFAYNKKKLLAIIPPLVFCHFAFSQTGSLKGTVKDAETGETLIGATILIQGTTKGTFADADGNFIITNINTGKYTLTVSYVAYTPVTKSDITVENGKESVVNFLLQPVSYSFEEVTIAAKANRESENVLLIEQKKAMVALQAVGAKEMSRKGVGDAEAAVAKISGISKQEGVKNVFVRGLGDRYNVTLLNGFPIPSEDPEYKNISLDFFSTDIIQSIGVNKVFSSNHTGDVGGAVIDISSKELFSDRAFNIDLSGGLNTAVAGVDFSRQDGSGYFGFVNTTQPTEGKYDFPNSLDPSMVNMSLNHSYGFSGGKLFSLGENNNPLSLFLVASHTTNYSFTKETIRGTNTIGTIYQDQTGNKYSLNTNQLILTNVALDVSRAHSIAYNFMLLHVNNQYVGEYSGMHSEKYQDSEDYIGFLRRQQTNDNLLFVHQITSDWKLSERLNFNAGVSYNSIKGVEPDRRENNLSRRADNSYILTGSNRQKRFFSDLKENDYNIKGSLNYKLNDRFENTHSAIIIGYSSRFVDDKFSAIEYNSGSYYGTASIDIDDLKLDELYNQASYSNGEFTMTRGETNSYSVTKYIHAGYVEGIYQLAPKLTASLGLKADLVDLTIKHQVVNVNPGKKTIDKLYYLPRLNLKYDINKKNSLRLGLSKTYTLPQSKEISPYQYVNIGFASQGNANLQPSDNYNADLKWDYYITASELISVSTFYKHVVDPIGRVDQGNSAGLLSYANLSSSATIAGVELEMRKNLVSMSYAGTLSFGLNASYIYTDLVTDIVNTPDRHTQLEGAAPFITNIDISYNAKNLTTSLVFNYFSDRIYTIGTQTYKDIIEEGVPTLDFVSFFKFSKHFSVKLKATNLLNPSYRLTRENYGGGNGNGSNKVTTLNEYKKGMNISLGISFEL